MIVYSLWHIDGQSQMAVTLGSSSGKVLQLSAACLGILLPELISQEPIFYLKN